MPCLFRHHIDRVSFRARHGRCGARQRGSQPLRHGPTAGWNPAWRGAFGLVGESTGGATSSPSRTRRSRCRSPSTIRWSSDLADLLNRLFRRRLSQYQGFVGQVAKQRVFEGDRSSIQRPTGDSETTDFEDFSGASVAVLPLADGKRDGEHAHPHVRGAVGQRRRTRTVHRHAGSPTVSQGEARPAPPFRDRVPPPCNAERRSLPRARLQPVMVRPRSGGRSAGGDDPLAGEPVNHFRTMSRSNR